MGDYPLDKFEALVDSCLRLAARKRLEYISDTQMAIAAVFSSKAKSAVKEHIETLREIAES